MTIQIQKYRFLTNLRNSGAVNMWGATPYLEETFDISRQEANTILFEWMKSFDLPIEEQPQDGR